MMALRSPKLGSLHSRLFSGISCRAVARSAPLVVRATGADTDDEKRKKVAMQIEASLKSTGLDAKSAKTVLDAWSTEVGHEVTPEDLRKILVGQTNKALALVLISTLFDAGAAYGAFVAGGYLGLASEQYGVAAIVGQAIAYLLAGYYVTGAAFDLFKLGTVAVARMNFSVNAGAFLEAIEDIAGTGLDVADKASEAVNGVKVLGALRKMSEALAATAAGASDQTDLLADLGAYLTLDRAQKAYGFDAAAFGITDRQAADIAVIFDRFDTNGDGVLSGDEFRRLCGEYAPELATPAEVAAALQVIDTNRDGTIQFTEFVRFWTERGEATDAAPA